MRSRVLTVEFQTALHHGSGFGLAGVVDRAILRDARSMPYLSGAALKGKFRWAAGRVLAASPGEKVCAQRPGEFCRREWCRLCRLFGAPSRRADARFEDGYPVERGLVRAMLDAGESMVLAGASEVRAATGIDRRRRIVKSEHLFFTETVPPAIVFESRITGDLDTKQLKLLQQSALILTNFGGDSSRGLGFCRYSIGAEEDAP